MCVRVSVAIVFGAQRSDGVREPVDELLQAGIARVCAGFRRQWQILVQQTNMQYSRCVVSCTSVPVVHRSVFVPDPLARCTNCNTYIWNIQKITPTSLVDVYNTVACGVPGR